MDSKKKILFVDDEPNVLDALRKALHFCAPQWDMHFCTSGTEALKKMEAIDFDVLVADLQMPQMDGLTVLKKAHAQFPHVIRLVLTGRDDMEMDLRKEQIAHHFLVKPCQATVVKRVIDRAYNLKAYLNQTISDGNLKKLQGLPEVPRIYASLTNAFSNPKTTTNDIIKILETDKSLMDYIMRFSESLMIGKSDGPKDLSDAIVSMGIKLLKYVTLSGAVFQLSKSNISSSTQFDVIHQHAWRTAHIARELFVEFGHREDIFVSALLHDIGKWIVGIIEPDLYKKVFDHSTQHQCTFYKAESQYYQPSHAEIGAFLLEQWGLNYPIVEAVAYHHTPHLIPDTEGYSIASAIYLANHLEKEQEIPSSHLIRWGLESRIDKWRQQAKKVAGRMVFPGVTVQPATIAEIGTDIVNRHRGLNNGGHDVGETRGAAA